jgi:hypothetical protein
MYPVPLYAKHTALVSCLAACYTTLPEHTASVGSTDRAPHRTDTFKVSQYLDKK